MNKIILYGCSFTAGNGCLFGDKYNQKYRRSNDDLPWGTIISNILKLPVYNYGMGGYSNDKILDTILMTYDKINEGDIVIIESSFSHRFDIPNRGNNNFLTMAPNPSNLLIGEYHKKEIENISYIATLMCSDLFKKRQLLRFEFIKHLILDHKHADKCIIWDIEENIHKYEKIFEATNNEINDHHWSFKGHKDFANNMIKLIENNG